MGERTTCSSSSGALAGGAAVAVAVAEADDARVAAGAVTVAPAQLVEHSLQGGDARGARRARLAAPSGRGGLPAVAGVEEGGGLSAQVERPRGRVFALQGARALGERDRPLDEGPKLLRLLHGRLDAL